MRRKEKKQNKGVLIKGNTYPVKSYLALMGGQYDPSRKGWWVPRDKANQARELVSRGGPPGHRQHPTRVPAHKTEPKPPKIEERIRPLLEVSQEKVVKRRIEALQAQIGAYSYTGQDTSALEVELTEALSQLADMLEAT